MGVDAAERGEVLRQRQDAVILRDEKQLAALLREVPPDLLRRDGLVVDGDAELPRPLYDGIFFSTKYSKHDRNTSLPK